MNFFKNTLAIIILFSSGSLLPKAVTQPTVKRTQSTKKPATKTIPTTVITVKTYKQLIDEVKNSKDAWNNSTKELNPYFTKRIGDAALAANLEDYQFDVLLQMARDYHANFTGDPKKDKEILNSLAQERQKLVEWFNIGKNQN